MLQDRHKIEIRDVDEKKDVGAISSIYNHFVVSTDVTFETTPVSDEDMAARIAAISARYSYLVCVVDGVLAGYAYVHEWNTKEAYRTSAESTIYLSPKYSRKGLGTMLLDALEEKCRKRGLVALVALITASNESSCLFHESRGYKRVGCLSSIGRKFGRYLDVAIYEHLLCSRI